jgi:hypothetical protein
LTIYLSTAVTTPNEVAMPTSFNASNVQPRQLTLSWVDNATNETGFVLDRRNVTTGESYALLQNLGADVVNYVDTTVLPGNSYQYRILARNATAQSAYIYLSTAVTTPNDVAMPTSFNASNVQPRQLTLSWVDNAINETGFVLDRRNVTTGESYALLQNLGRVL